MEQPEILLVAFSVAVLTYFLSPLMMTIPKVEIAKWGAIMRNDSIISMIAIGSVSSIQLLLEFVQKMMADMTGSSTVNSSHAFATILSQLVVIDTALVGIVGILSTVPALQGIGIVMGHVLGPAISSVTGSIILWTTLQMVGNIMPVLFLTMFSIGLCLFSIPFRLGRKSGAFTIALSMVFFVGLPMAAPIALWLEGYLFTSSDLDGLSGISKTKPEKLLDLDFLRNFLIGKITEVVARIVGGVVIALIVFPTLYIGLLFVMARSLASVIGG